MIKILIAFIVFAAVAVYILTRSGGDIDLTGEKHSVEAPAVTTTTTPAAAPAAPASAATPAASAASQ